MVYVENFATYVKYQ